MSNKTAGLQIRTRISKKKFDSDLYLKKPRMRIWKKVESRYIHEKTPCIYNKPYDPPADKYNGSNI